MLANLPNLSQSFSSAYDTKANHFIFILHSKTHAQCDIIHVSNENTQARVEWNGANFWDDNQADNQNWLVAKTI